MKPYKPYDPDAYEAHLWRLAQAHVLVRLAKDNDIDVRDADGNVIEEQLAVLMQLAADNGLLDERGKLIPQPEDFEATHPKHPPERN